MLSWADAVMLRSKTTSSRPREAAKGLSISSGSAANRFSRCGLTGLFESRCARQGRRRRERLDHRSKERTATGKAVRNTVYPFRVTANCSKWGLLSMSRSDEYRRFAAECLKMAQTAEEEKNRATFLQMARMWFALAEREEARSSRNDHPKD
jgi:hypothetical protein